MIVLTKDSRGAYVGTIKEDLKIPDRVDIKQGSKFVVWTMESTRRNVKLLEYVPPGEDVQTDAIILAKLYLTKDKSHYYGKRKVNLLKPGVNGEYQFTKKADFNLYDNKDNLRLRIK